MNEEQRINKYNSWTELSEARLSGKVTSIRRLGEELDNAKSPEAGRQARLPIRFR